MLMPKQTPGRWQPEQSATNLSGLSPQVCTLSKLERCAVAIARCNQVCQSEGRQSDACYQCRENLGDCEVCTRVAITRPNMPRMSFTSSASY
jgi:hypothetical protein